MGRGGQADQLVRSEALGHFDDGEGVAFGFGQDPVSDVAVEFEAGRGDQQRPRLVMPKPIEFEYWKAF